MKRGDFVQVTYCDQTKRAMLLLVSPNEKSLMLGFEGALYDRDGGCFVGTMPVLMDEAGDYRDLISDELVTIEQRPRLDA